MCMNFSVIPTNLSSKATKIGVIEQNALSLPQGDRTPTATHGVNTLKLMKDKSFK